LANGALEIPAVAVALFARLKRLALAEVNRVFVVQVESTVAVALPTLCPVPVIAAPRAYLEVVAVVVFAIHVADLPAFAAF
jgi:hypothetical protein